MPGEHQVWPSREVSWLKRSAKKCSKVGSFVFSFDFSGSGGHCEALGFGFHRLVDCLFRSSDSGDSVDSVDSITGTDDCAV